jgi:hypothetical protein
MVPGRPVLALLPLPDAGVDGVVAAASRGAAMAAAAPMRCAAKSKRHRGTARRAFAVTRARQLSAAQLRAQRSFSRASRWSATLRTSSIRSPARD